MPRMGLRILSDFKMPYPPFIFGPLLTSSAQRREEKVRNRDGYEGSLRAEIEKGNLLHDPTMNPGLGSPRCPRCLSLLNPNSDKAEWTVTSVLHDATAVAGSGIGAMLSAVHGFNPGIPFLQNRLTGSKWLPFVTGIPLLLTLSRASPAFGEGIKAGSFENAAAA